MIRRGFWISSVVLAMLAAASSLAANAQARQSGGETVRHAARDRGQQMRALHQSLRAAEPRGIEERALTVTLSFAEKALAEPVSEGRYRVGVSKSVSVEFDASLATVSFGVRELRADGEVTWSGVVRSPGASALRLHFSQFDLPEGAELYVYGPERQAFGPYTGRGPLDEGELWTNTIRGEEMRLRLRLPSGAPRAKLVLADLGYMGRAFPRTLAEVATFCPANASCVVNAACATTIPAAVKPAQEAVADMLFASGAYYYLCTGGLLADSDPNSDVPYFLTANHCISKRGEASSLETYFDYVTDCSSPNCTVPFDQDPRNPDTLGAVIRSTNRTGDYTLLQLSSVPAAKDGVQQYLGWTADAVANTNGVRLYRFSHPQGSPQAYSEQVVDITKPTCGSWPRGSWIYSRDVLGATEGGSSGSPVLNGSGQVVGQLSGACGTNVNDVCDAIHNATVDGAFASYFDQVAAFLGGGGQCRPKGQSCSMDSECCSNSCRGKAGAKTCK